MKNSILQNIAKFILLIVGALSTWLSFLYSWEWLKYIGVPLYISILMAFILVVFAVVIFEIAALIIKDNRRSVFGYILFFVWACLAFYSVQGTVSAQFYQLQEKLNSDKISQSKEMNTKNILTLISKQIDNLQMENNNHQAEIDKIAYDPKKNKWLSNWYVKKKLKNTEKINELSEKRLSIMETSSDMVISEDRDKKTIFQFYSGLLKVSPERIQLFLNMFPAVMLDLISPLCFYFFLSDHSKADISKKSVKKKTAEKPVKHKKPKSWRDAIEMFINISFHGIDKGQTKFLMPRQYVVENSGIIEHQYDKIMKASIDNHLIMASGDNYRLQPFIKKEEFYNSLMNITEGKT